MPCNVTCVWVQGVGALFDMHSKWTDGVQQIIAFDELAEGE